MHSFLHNDILVVTIGHVLGEAQSGAGFEIALGALQFVRVFATHMRVVVGAVGVLRVTVLARVRSFCGVVVNLKTRALKRFSNKTNHSVHIKRSLSRIFSPASFLAPLIGECCWTFRAFDNSLLLLQLHVYA